MGDALNQLYRHLDAEHGVTPPAVFATDPHWFPKLDGYHRADHEQPAPPGQPDGGAQ